MKSGNQRIISVESRGDIMEESISRRKFLGAMAAALRQAIEIPAGQCVDAQVAQATIPLPPLADVVPEEQEHVPGVPFQVPADLPRFVGREQEIPQRDL